MMLGNDGALKGRLLAIVIFTAISGGSFTLGYFVGKTAVTPERPVEVAESSEAPDEIVEETAPAEKPPEVIEEPGMLRSTLDVPPSGEHAGKETLNVKKSAPRKQPQSVYSVQAGVFEEKTYAEAFAEKLKKRGYGAYIQGSGKAYKVKVGRFEDKADADALALKLKEAEGIEGFVVVGPG